MSQSRTSKSLSAALACVLEYTPGVRREPVALEDALHRVVAEDIRATADSPPFDKALMDGFAVNASAITASANDEFVQLNVVETVTAGQVPERSVDGLTASRIMTGSQLPEGCDCVIPIEQVDFDESKPQVVTIDAKQISTEQCLIRQGTAARKGEPLIRSGGQLFPQQIASLAEFGIGEIQAAQRPSVAVLATGDELVPLRQQPGPGQIRNSNEPMLCAMIKECGAAPFPLGIARDNVDSLSVLIQEGLKYDMLLLSGGVSAGMLDLVPSQLNAAGVRQVFHGVNLKPGRPLWFGIRQSDTEVTARELTTGRDAASQPDGCLVFGLPGNPVSSLTCFQLFVVPAIRRALGLQPELRRRQAELAEQKTVRGSRPVWHPAHLSLTDGKLMATIVPWSGSSDLRATVEANGMCELQPDHGTYQPGDTVDCILWNATI